MTSKRILTFIIVVPVAVVLIAFIVANRTPAKLALNPFNPDAGAFTFTAPFFVWLFISLAIGIVVGGITMWFSQRKYRKAARDRQVELKNCLKKMQQEQNHLPLS